MTVQFKHFNSKNEDRSCCSNRFFTCSGQCAHVLGFTKTKGYDQRSGQSRYTSFTFANFKAIDTVDGNGFYQCAEYELIMPYDTVAFLFCNWIMVHFLRTRCKNKLLLFVFIHLDL